MKRMAVVISILLSIFLNFYFAIAEEISEEARKHFLKGLKAVENARTPRDYLVAEEEFERVVELSPQWADAHINLALISEELGKQAKAIKCYQKYLKITNEPPDKQDILAKIEILKKARETKRKIGLAGISLASLKDGIYILKLTPGSKLEKPGFKSGDRIIEVNKRKTEGMKLDEFYKLIETAHEHQMLQERVSAYGRKTGISNPVAFKVIRGGTPLTIISPIEIFRTAIYEIEEDEFEEEVIRSEIPVAVVSWIEWCSFCSKFIPILEDISEGYKGKIKIVTINIELNKKFSDKFSVKAAPVTILFDQGKPVRTLWGFKEKDLFERWLRGDN